MGIVNLNRKAYSPTVERWAAKTLRIVGIVAAVILVIGGCYFLLAIAFVVVIRGGLTRNAMIFHPRAANSFFGALLASFALVTTGVLVIRRLAKGIAGGPARSPLVATTSGPAAAGGGLLGVQSSSPASPSVRLHLSRVGRNTINRLVLLLVAQIAVSAITLFQLTSRAFVPHSWTLMLLPPFILSEAPYVILIYVLRKQPGRSAFTFLIAVLAIPILEALFNPLIRLSYRQIYIYQPMGFVWLVVSGLIYLVTLFLAYKAIQQTGLRPKPAPVILATVAMFFYFFFTSEITPYLYSFWR